MDQYLRRLRDRTQTRGDGGGDSSEELRRETGIRCRERPPNDLAAFLRLLDAEKRIVAIWKPTGNGFRYPLITGMGAGTERKTVREKWINKFLKITRMRRWKERKRIL